MIYNAFQNVLVTIRRSKKKRQKNTKGISISPIFNHPVYCTFDHIKFLFHFYFSHYIHKHIIYVPTHKKSLALFSYAVT
jgi:hypothetical protein